MPETHAVDYSAARARKGPLTWAQREMGNLIEAAPPDSRHLFNIPLVLRVPAGCSLTEALAAVRAAVQTHVPLRTAFEGASFPELTLRTREFGSVDVTVVEGERTQLGSTARVVRNACRYTCPAGKSAYEDPVRIAITTLDGSPAYLSLCISHLTADGVGVRNLAKYLTHRLWGIGVDDGFRESNLEPVDVADFEASPDGGRRDAKAARYWRQCLGELSDEACAPVRGTAGAAFPRVRLQSWALRTAHAVLARRYRVSQNAVLCTAMLYLMCAKTGRRRFLCGIPASNRATSEARSYTGLLAQHGFALWQVVGSDFGKTAKAVFTANLRAFRHGRYNPATMAEVFGGWNGFDHLMYTDCMVNDVHTVEVSGGPEVDPGIREAMAASRVIDEHPATESGRFWFWVRGIDKVEITFGSRPDFMSAGEMKQALWDVERLCVALALGEPYELAGFGRIG
jgi:hypothetical protein